MEVDTPNGSVSYPPPAPIFIGHERSYGAVPGLGEHSVKSFGKRS
jgi:formyl-CoA transferase